MSARLQAALSQWFRDVQLSPCTSCVFALLTHRWSQDHLRMSRRPLGGSSIRTAKTRVNNTSLHPDILLNRFVIYNLPFITSLNIQSAWSSDWTVWGFGRVSVIVHAGKAGKSTGIGLVTWRFTLVGVAVSLTFPEVAGGQIHDESWKRVVWCVLCDPLIAGMEALPVVSPGLHQEVRSFGRWHAQSAWKQWIMGTLSLLWASMCSSSTHCLRLSVSFILFWVSHFEISFSGFLEQRLLIVCSWPPRLFVFDLLELFASCHSCSIWLMSFPL